MVAWRAVPTDDPAAHALLQEYFDGRSVSFPAEQGAYRISFPPPEQFTSPDGVFLIAVDGDGTAAACGGLRRIDPATGGASRFEVKHLYVRPEARGRGLGRALLDELEARARLFRAAELVLDTNESLEAAGSLYTSSGFVIIDPYNDNPNATHWYGKVLSNPASAPAD